MKYNYFYSIKWMHVFMERNLLCKSNRSSNFNYFHCIKWIYLQKDISCANQIEAVICTRYWFSLLFLVSSSVRMAWRRGVHLQHEDNNHQRVCKTKSLAMGLSLTLELPLYTSLDNWLKKFSVLHWQNLANITYIHGLTELIDQHQRSLHFREDHQFKLIKDFTKIIKQNFE